MAIRNDDVLTRSVLALALACVPGSCVPAATGADREATASPVAATSATTVVAGMASTAPGAAPAPSQPVPSAPVAAAAVTPAIQLSAAAGEQGALLSGTVTPADGTLTLDGEPIAVASDGRFIIGFDRDATGTHVLRLDPGDGRPIVERSLPVMPRAWDIQNVDAPVRGGASSDAEFNRRRPAEIAQMVEARARVVESDGWRQHFIWPARGRISGVFGSQRIYRGTPGSYHNGVDIAAASGTPYVAPADGVVILAASEPFTLEGYLLMIDHGHGLSSVFLHSSRLDVHTGDVVRQGQQLGAVGMTGRATGPHLHWAMRWNGQKIDAQRLAGPMTAASR